MHNHAKAVVVNEILQKKVLPVNNSSTHWRSVHFCYGSRASVSLQVAGSYELVDRHSVSQKLWSSVAEEDLIVDDLSDTALEIAELEVKLCHELLKEGGLLTVAPTFAPNCEKDVKDFITKCTSDVIPVVIYGIASSRLSEQVHTDYFISFLS